MHEAPCLELSFLLEAERSSESEPSAHDDGETSSSSPLQDYYLLAVGFLVVFALV